MKGPFMQEHKTLVFDIEKFAVNDGPGIRTVVFLKGCPLRCIWCHNPESQTFNAELLFNSERCVNCMMCAGNCPEICHRAQEGRHIFDRNKCVSCGRCSVTCPSGALNCIGQKLTVNDVMKEVMKDLAFYRNSGGGLTISGGEPLAHFTFTYALLKEAKTSGLHTVIETCGFAPWEQIAELLPLVDLWVWDIKSSPAKHRELTGVPIDTILENLQKLTNAGGQVILSCPLIPGVNDEDEHLLQIAEIANRLPNVQGIDLKPYHPMGENKNRQLGRKKYFKSDFASAEEKKRWLAVITAQTAVKVHLH